MKAAVEAKNRCELVVLLAEARIGAELKAAQDRGEVATRQHGGANPPDGVRRLDTVATLPEIGIPRQRAAESGVGVGEGGDAREADENIP